MGCTNGKPNSDSMNKKKNFCTQPTSTSHYISSKSATMDMNGNRGSEFFESADICLEVVRAIKQRKREQYEECGLSSRLSIN